MMTYQEVWSAVNTILNPEDSFALRVGTWRHYHASGDGGPHIVVEWELWHAGMKRCAMAASGEALVALLRAERAPVEQRLAEVGSVTLPPQPAVEA